MTETLDARVNARVPSRLKHDLAALARRRHVDESELARTLLDEALRREQHPGIVFRSTPTGREAAIEGRRLYVWQVMETLWASDGDIDKAAKFLGVRPEDVRASTAYYADYRSEIDELLVLNRDETDRLRNLSERQQKVQRR
jgi:uncharacterized protein (DUF433 family)